jgi:hypothetical protein
LQNIPIFAALNYQCPDGEIGRRTVFRSQRSQGCAGSNPVLGTLKALKVLIFKAFFIAVCQKITLFPAFYRFF